MCRALVTLSQRHRQCKQCLTIRVIRTGAPVCAVEPLLEERIRRSNAALVRLRLLIDWGPPSFHLDRFANIHNSRPLASTSSGTILTHFDGEGAVGIRGRQVSNTTSRPHDALR